MKNKTILKGTRRGREKKYQMIRKRKEKDSANPVIADILTNNMLNLKKRDNMF